MYKINLMISYSMPQRIKVLTWRVKDIYDISNNGKVIKDIKYFKCYNVWYWPHTA